VDVDARAPIGGRALLNWKFSIFNFQFPSTL
jgi:hypothetical protein